MAPSIQVFVQVVLLCCVVTTSMGGLSDWQKAFSQLENKVKVSQEEIESLHQIIEQLEKRLELLEGKDGFGEFQIHLAVPVHPAVIMPVSQDYSPVDFSVYGFTSLYNVSPSRSVLKK